MIAAIFIGALTGCVAGFGVGLLIAVTSRDGIWPNLWALLIVVSTSVGGILGMIDWALS